MWAFLSVALLFTGFVQPPPAKYDKAYPGMRVQYAAPGQIRRWCGHPKAVACAVKIGSACTILLPRGTRRGSLLWRHERAHCNGWPADHPST